MLEAFSTSPISWFGPTVRNKTRTTCYRRKRSSWPCLPFHSWRLRLPSFSRQGKTPPWLLQGHTFSIPCIKSCITIRGRHSFILTQILQWNFSSSVRACGSLYHWLFGTWSHRKETIKQRRRTNQSSGNLECFPMWFWHETTMQRDATIYKWSTSLLGPLCTCLIWSLGVSLCALRSLQAHLYNYFFGGLRTHFVRLKK